MNEIINNNLNNLNNVNNVNNVNNMTVENEYTKKKYNIRSKIKSQKEKKVVESIEIPTYSSHNTFLNKTYTIPQLKEICKFYKLKVTGNKQVLKNQIYLYLFESSYAIVFQRIWKKKLYKIYSKLRGPAKFNRNLCVNETDFFTMESLKDIPFEQFFSYTDIDGKIYGFDIVSLYNLLDNEKLKDSNPYNRNPIPLVAKINFKRLINISKAMGENLEMNLEIEENVADPAKIIEIRTMNLFREIDSLGNYTNPLWFSQLNQRQIVRFLQELRDIWVYRAHLDNITMIEVCPPNGNPFELVDINNITNTPLYTIKTTALLVMEKLVKNGIERESRILGTNYVLCALTLVSNEAATALPWLYQSVAHFV